jgi:hypothetical protein
VRRNQRRVDADHDPRGRSTGVPCVLARPRASGAQRLKQRRVGGDRVDDSERRRVRGDVPEQRLLVAHGAQVWQAVAAVGQHHRQVAHDAAGVVSAAPLTHRGQPARQRPRQAEPVGRLGQQPGARVRHQALSVRRRLLKGNPVRQQPFGA